MSFEIANASQAISSEIVCQHIRLEMSCNTPVILRNAPKLELKCCKYRCTYALLPIHSKYKQSSLDMYTSPDKSHHRLTNHLMET